MWDCNHAWISIGKHTGIFSRVKKFCAIIFHSAVINGIYYICELPFKIHFFFVFVFCRYFWISFQFIYASQCLATITAYTPYRQTMHQALKWPLRKIWWWKKHIMPHASSLQIVQTTPVGSGARVRSMDTSNNGQRLSAAQRQQKQQTAAANVRGNDGTTSMAGN